MMLFVVAFHPDTSWYVEAVGPFRSREKADAVCERLSGSLDPLENFDGEQINRMPHVVPLTTEREAVAEHGLNQQIADGGQSTTHHEAWGIWKGGAQVVISRDEQTARAHVASPIHGGTVVHVDRDLGRWVDDDSNPITGPGWKGGGQS